MKGAATPGTQTVVTFTYKPEQPDPLIVKYILFRQKFLF